MEIIATLIVLFKPSEEGEWEERDKFLLQLPTIRIGRSSFCEVVLNYRRQGQGAYVSRHHASLFKWADKNDYEIQDGTRTDATIATPITTILPSGAGTAVNGKKLKLGETILLKDGDRIAIVPNQIELIYLRPQHRITDHIIEDLTYVPADEPTGLPK